MRTIAKKVIAGYAQNAIYSVAAGRKTFIYINRTRCTLSEM